MNLVLSSTYLRTFYAQYLELGELVGPFWGSARKALQDKPLVPVYNDEYDH